LFSQTPRRVGIVNMLIVVCGCTGLLMLRDLLLTAAICYLGVLRALDYTHVKAHTPNNAIVQPLVWLVA
jgi:hypothetical protein